MAITFKTPLTAGDLILKEQNPFDGYTRGNPVTVTLTAAQKIQLGSPLFRAKGVAGAKWVPVTAATALVDTNEIAFYLANERGVFEDTVGVTGGGDVKVAAIQMGNIVLKDKAIKDALKVNFAAFSTADFAKVKEMALEKQIIIEEVLGA